MRGAIFILQSDGHICRGVGRDIQIGNNEVLLETATSVAFGEEPIICKRLHSHDITATRDGMGIPSIDVAEVVGTLHHYRLRRGDDSCHMLRECWIGTTRHNRPACSAGYR